jgi:molybdopterin-containing oxidoreductase family membrane subunit
MPVIAVAEIKHILKKSGENYKKKMDVVEKEDPEDFAHGAAH